MARKKRKSGLGMLLRFGISVVMIVVVGLVGIIGLKWKKSYDKQMEIPYQKINLEETIPAEKYYYGSLPENERIIYQEILQGLFDGEKEIYLHSADAKKNNELFQFVLNDYP